MTLQALQHENAIHPGKRIPKLFYLLETRHIINAAQPAHAADRCARAILAILECDPTRLRRLMPKALGAHDQPLCHLRARAEYFPYK
jgi:hypothetical protein